MSLTREQHRNRAIFVSRVPAHIYDAMNSANEAQNKLIREERAAHSEKLMDFAVGLAPHPGDLKFSFEA